MAVMARDSSTHSLTGKLLFWVTLITAATLIGVVWASTSVSQRVLQQRILRDAESAAEDVALELITARDPVELIQETVWANKLLRRLSLRKGLKGIQIEVVSNGRSGRLEAASSEPRAQALIEFDDVEIGQLVARSAEERLEVVVRQELPDGHISIRVVASTEVISVFLNVIYRNAVWMGLAAWLVLVLTIAAFVHRTVTRPLRRVAQAVGEVADGHLGEHVEQVSTAEVEPLVVSFNRMSDRLETTEEERGALFDEVEALNRDLQQRVEDATAALASAQADLARQDRLAALGELVGTIAHEVGTPLNSVLAHLDLLAEDLPPEVDRHRLEIASSEIERVSAVIRRYLRSTRAPTPKPTAVPLDEVLRESIRVFEAQASSSGVRLSVVSDPGSFPTDRDLLAQIVRNLVSNALGAVSEGGFIEVRGIVRQKGMRISVTDDGVGMDEQTRSRVFEPFFSARRDGSGTGLGMAIVRNAVASLDGEVSVVSEPGVGTTVTLEFGQSHGFDDGGAVAAAEEHE